MLKTKLANKFSGLLFMGSGLLVTTLLSSCTVNVKHTAVETTKEVGKPKKEEPKSSQATDKTTDLVVYRSVIIEKETPKVKVVKGTQIVDPRRYSSNVWVRIDAKLDSIDNKLDNLKSIKDNTKEINTHLKEIVAILREKKEKGLL